jgi:catechol 2,3-dioxygenase|tara:strand:- start:346 stop:981 length:636 start_codon:yes stop_codon:yes gene_type:complete
MLNDETIIHPTLHHVGLTTANIERLSTWYETVLGMRLVYRSDDPLGGQGELRPKAAWFSNDAANHRVAVVELPNLEFDEGRAGHTRLQHIAFAYSTLDELLGTYARLSKLGIDPVVASDEGAQIALYYEDPDRNIIELNVSNYEEPVGQNWTSISHMQNSPEFAKRPIGVFIDPDKMVAARMKGASAWELHKRAFANEFAPEKPYDPSVML